MSESDEKRELGGLARSIDALFSQGRSGPAAERSEGAPPIATEPEEVSSAEPIYSTEAGHQADPFDSFDPDEGREETEVTELEAAFGAVEIPASPSVPPDAEMDAEMEAPATPPPLPYLQDEPAAEPVAAATELQTSGPPPLPETEAEPTREPTSIDLASGSAESPPLPDVRAETEPAEGESRPEVVGADLTKAVDHFLAGHPGTRGEVESLAATLRERLALDPVADAVERLVDAADGDEDDPALDMAARITNPAVASRLVQRMASEDDDGRRADYVILAERLGIVMANAFKGALTDAPDARTRRACHEGLIAMGDSSRPVIEAMLEDDNRFLVQSAVAILGETGGEGALELVTSALADTDFRVRREAIAALAKLGGEESGQLVMASLDDTDPTVRAAAAEAAGRLGIERALRPILALLDEEDLEDDVKIPVQVQALRALGHLGDPGAVQAIEKRAVGSLFSKPPTEVRVAAYQALHAIGTPHARQLIDKARDDKDPVVRTTARGLASG